MSVNGVGQNEAQISIYPNPSAGAFTVVMPKTGSAATITVTNIFGRVVEIRQVAGSIESSSFDLGKEARGNYIIKVNIGDKVYREKVTLW